MENSLRTKLIDEARRNGSKFGKKAELDFGAGAEWMYNEMQKQLTLTDVIVPKGTFNCGQERAFGKEKCKQQCKECLVGYSDN